MKVDVFHPKHDDRINCIQVSKKIDKDGYILYAFINIDRGHDGGGFLEKLNAGEHENSLYSKEEYEIVMRVLDTETEKDKFYYYRSDELKFSHSVKISSNVIKLFNI